MAGRLLVGVQCFIFTFSVYDDALNIDNVTFCNFSSKCAERLVFSYTLQKFTQKISIGLFA